MSLCGVYAQAPPTESVIGIELNDALPYGQKPIDYFGETTDNAVTRLQDRIKRGDVRLTIDETQGYLPALLRALDISASSQMLVFSKTSFQFPLTV